MAARPKIILVGPLSDSGDAVAAHLHRRGYEIARAAEAWQAGAMLADGEVDVAVVDLALADAALDLLRANAFGGGPSYVVIARGGDVVDRVLALEMGASDVVEPPVVPRELAARIAGLVARRGRVHAELVALERSTVDLRAALVMHHRGEEDLLSPGQIALLRFFAANPGIVLSREDIIAAAPAETTDAFDRSIDSRIVRLRRKLDTDSIATIRGSGYRFDPPF